MTWSFPVTLTAVLQSTSFVVFFARAEASPSCVPISGRLCMTVCGPPAVLTGPRLLRAPAPPQTALQDAHCETRTRFGHPSNHTVFIAVILTSRMLAMVSSTQVPEGLISSRF